MKLGDLAEGQNPLTGNKVSGADGFVKLAVGSAMVIGGTMVGSYAVNKISEAAGVSESDTSIRVV